MPKINRKILSKTGGSSELPEAHLRSFDLLVGKLRPIDLEGRKEATEKLSEVINCEDYDELIESWRKSMRWRNDLEVALTAMLAVAISTEQVGDQLFLQIIGDPGSGKSRFCDAFLTSQACYAIESITGFVSGWSGSSGDEDNNDFSLLSRVNGKIMITPEADVIMNSPGVTTTLSQMRRMFDGQMTATYKNRKNDLKYDGLRTPWIMAGTYTLLDSDQSRLGDRFLKVFVDTPSVKEKRNIQRVVAQSMLSSLSEVVGEDDKQTSNAATTESNRKTGGYVDYLRENAVKLIRNVNFDEDQTVRLASDLGEFVADFRARPRATKDASESAHSKEMPTRLTAQFARLIICIAACMQKTEICEQTKRIAVKIAMDTAFGKSLLVARHLYAEEELDVRGLSIITHIEESELRKLLVFMSSPGVMICSRIFKKRGNKRVKTNRWKLTNRCRQIFSNLKIGDN